MNTKKEWEEYWSLMGSTRNVNLLQTNLDHLNSQLEKLDNYQCDCIRSIGTGHSPTCQAVIAGEIRKQLLIIKMEFEIML